MTVFGLEGVVAELDVDNNKRVFLYNVDDIRGRHSVRAIAPNAISCAQFHCLFWQQATTYALKLRDANAALDLVRLCNSANDNTSSSHIQSDVAAFSRANQSGSPRPSTLRSVHMMVGC